MTSLHKVQWLSSKPFTWFNKKAIVVILAVDQVLKSCQTFPKTSFFFTHRI